MATTHESLVARRNQLFKEINELFREIKNATGSEKDQLEARLKVLQKEKDTVAEEIFSQEPRVGVDVGDIPFSTCKICGEYVWESEVDDDENAVKSNKAFFVAFDPRPPHHNRCLPKFMETGTLIPEAMDYYQRPLTFFTKEIPLNVAVSYVGLGISEEEKAAAILVKMRADAKARAEAFPGLFKPMKDPITWEEARSFLIKRALQLMPQDGTKMLLSLTLSGTVGIPVFVCRCGLRPNMIWPGTKWQGNILSPYEKLVIKKHRDELKLLEYVIILPSKNPDANEISRKNLCRTGVIAAVSILDYKENADYTVEFRAVARVRAEWQDKDSSALIATATLIEEKNDLDPNDDTTKARLENLLMIVKDLNTKVFPENVVNLWLNYADVIRMGKGGLLLDSFAMHAGEASAYSARLFKYRYAAFIAASLNHRLTKTVKLGSITYQIAKSAEESLKISGEKQAHREHNMQIRAQIAQLQQELGEDSLAADYERRLAELPLPPDVRKQADEKLTTLRNTNDRQGEYSYACKYLNLILALPWTHGNVEETFDIKTAKAILDLDTYGLDAVKDRIIEFLAVRVLRRLRGVKLDQEYASIIRFIGPPGVGKTALGRGIAGATGRKFVRISVGGVRDETKIRGLEYGYVGAHEGCFLRTVKNEGTTHLVVQLDEIDKVGSDSIKGDVQSALLEALDPEQNNEFGDAYLGAKYDLSQIFFILTGNTDDPIMPALKDRSELIEIAGYTDDEKFVIARDYVVRRQYRQNALNTDKIECTFTDPAIKGIIKEYTRESGIRESQRMIEKICRKVARKIVEGKLSEPVEITRESLPSYLGPPKFTADREENISRLGVAVGLVVDSRGSGKTIYVEAVLDTREDGDPLVVVTGLAGKMAQESAMIAYKAVKARLDEFGLAFDVLERKQICFNFDQTDGDLGVEGPSAGLAMASALLSLLMKRKFRPDVAMTGALNLSGISRKIGSLQGKVLGAKQVGKRRIVLPADNERDWNELPEAIREGISPHFVKDYKELPDLVLEQPQ